MKTILIATIAVLGMALAGWLTFASSEERLTIEVDKVEIREDTQEAVEAGEGLLNDISRETEEISKEAEDAVEDTQESTEEPTVTPLDQSFEEAETAKVNDKLPPNYRFEVLAPFHTILVQQIRRAIQMFLTTSGKERIDYLVVSGGTAHVEGIEELLNEDNSDVIPEIEAVKGPIEDITSKK